MAGRAPRTALADLSQDADSRSAGAGGADGELCSIPRSGLVCIVFNYWPMWFLEPTSRIFLPRLVGLQL
jgi:hypothetical protein